MYLFFLDHSRRGSSYHAGSSGAYKETAAVLTQNGAAKGSIYADTEILSGEDSATSFVILAASKRYKFQIICPMTGQGAFVFQLPRLSANIFFGVSECLADFF